MRVHICAVGRLRRGPEKDLVEDYLQRFDRTGRSIGLQLGGVIEVEDRKNGGKAAEAKLLEGVIPSGAAIWALDERGTQYSSPDVSEQLARLRDAGQGDLAIVIGGADGLDATLCARADARVSFGHMVWPHMLARVMLSEQLYRAASILTNSPYHRA